MTDTVIAEPAIETAPTPRASGFRPFVPDDADLRELTPGALVLGMVLGVLFAASSVYLALKIGLTVSASIPIAVLSITIFRYITRAFGVAPATILQNNMVQTTGSAGESIAAGTVFTLPALLLLGYALPWARVAAVAVVGGILGVLLMIPLRRNLIVEEHANLKYPEGTACAKVLIAGELGGVQARTIFMGFGLGVLYKFLNNGVHLWIDVARKAIERAVPGGRPALIGELQAEVSPELCGVGYIIGPRIAGYLFAGGMFTFFVMIPAIKLFGAGLTAPIYPATKLITDMDAMAIRANYTYYIGAGAVTAAGIISLCRALPTIVSAFIKGLTGFRRAAGGAATEHRTARDLPMIVVLVGSIAMVIAMVGLPGIGINLFGAILALAFAFLFVTVSSRITGQIGASSNPISGMTVATVLLTSLIFLAVGWTGVQHRVLALSIGGVVCIAAAVAGATSQDLKTGYLVGATPARQQIGLFAGVITSALMVGGIIQFLDKANTTIVERSYPGITVSDIDAAPYKLDNGQTFRVGHLYEREGLATPGRYLIDSSGAIRYLIDPGIGGHETVDYRGRKVTKLDSPKSQIMALVVDGILTGRLNWGLILIGAFFSIVLEILGIPSLPVATGSYLPLSTTATMFMGGVVRWLVERRAGMAVDQDSGPGVLFSSGLIAGGAITGVLLAALTVYHFDSVYNLGDRIGPIAENPLVSIAAFVLFLAIPLYRVARKG
ncbi:MAG TPA: oligopeptide transporter, OPT family [Gemmatimonadaceae bacterium]|nr:oligopeptide transporter, OPT family [Gemmatimonadaceae bacterium]